jgi:hypothetical protein
MRKRPFVSGLVFAGCAAAIFIWVLAVGILDPGATFGSQTDDSVSIEDVVDGYMKLNGGAQNIQNILSLRVQGEMITEADTQEFVILKRRPNFVRMIFERGGQRVAATYDGKETWLSLTAPPSPARIIGAWSGPEAENLKADSPFDSPLVRYQNDFEGLAVAGDMIIRGEPCWRIEVEPEVGRPHALFLKKENFREVMRLEDLGGGRQARIFFEDFRTVAGAFLPFRIERQETVLDAEGRIADWETVMTVQVDSVQANIGIPANLFERPETIPETQVDLPSPEIPASS